MTDVAIMISDDVFEAIAARAAELVLEELTREAAPSSPYLSVLEAADCRTGNGGTGPHVCAGQW